VFFISKLFWWNFVTNQSRTQKVSYAIKNVILKKWGLGACAKKNGFSSAFENKGYIQR
jgi:hypothetical protein